MSAALPSLLPQQDATETPILAAWQHQFLRPFHDERVAGLHNPWAAMNRAIDRQSSQPRHYEILPRGAPRSAAVQNGRKAASRLVSLVRLLAKHHHVAATVADASLESLDDT